MTQETSTTTITLFPHQVEAVEKLKASKGFLLSDDMGLGKTLTTLVAAKELKVAATVICPASLVQNWKSEAEKVSTPVKVFSYSKAAKDIAETPDLLILDESHYIKSPKSQRAKFCLALSGLVRARGGRVWLLSGTPITRDADDLYTQLLAIGAVPTAKSTGKPWSIHGWRRAVMVETPDRWSPTGVSYKGISQKGQKLLDAQLEGVFLQRKKDDVLDLPGKLHESITVGPLAASLRKELDKACKELDLVGFDEAKKSEHFMRVKKDLALAKALKVQALIKDELAEKQNFAPLVIFSDHLDSLKAIEMSFKEYRVATITGAVDGAERAKIVEDFQAGKVDILLATIRAAGVGITLTRSHDVRFIDLSYSPADNAQAEDRVYRIGQAQKVVVTHYTSGHPLERRIEKILREKAETIAKVA